MVPLLLRSSHDAVSSEDRAPADQTERTTLTRDLSEFLTELSIAVRRYAIYPEDHPSLGPAAASVGTRLTRLLQSRPRMSLGVAERQLVIEGVATDSKHPVLADLARRLHAHQIGAVTFLQGASSWECEGLLGTLATDPERGGTPIGELPRDEIPAWQHVQILPVGYDRLELNETPDGQGREPARATRLWLGLARAAMASDEELDPAAPPEAAVLAESIRSHRQEHAYDQVIVGYLLQLAEELKDGESVESQAVRRRMSALVRDLDKDTLGRLVRMGGSVPRRQRFVLDASQSLAADAVLKVVDAAATVSDQNISASLSRLLVKLAAHAERGAERVRPRANDALRDNVEELISGWELKDPNPEDYTLILDRMSQASSFLQMDDEIQELPGPMRLLQTSLEIDAYGPMVQVAFTDLVESGELSAILGLLGKVGEDNDAARLLRGQLDTPAQLRRILRGDDVDEEVLQTMTERIGEGAVPVLFAALVESEARSTRRKVFDRLASMAPAVQAEILELLDDDRWFVVRNGLALLQHAGPLPRSVALGPHLSHADARVRREALPLAFRQEGHRENAVRRGLSDEDERIVRMALVEVRNDLPDSVVPDVVALTLDTSRFPDLETLGLRTLGASRSDAALGALLGVCVRERKWLGRARLSRTSPALLAALEALRDGWATDERAQRVLSLARGSKDPAVRTAAERAGNAA